MKVLHLPFTYRPDPVGGTEIYVEALVRELRRHGVESMIAVPADADSTAVVQDVKVHRLRIGPLRRPDESYGEGDPGTARRFESLLDEERPDLVHFHARSRGVSLRMLRSAKRRGIPVVVTCHTPGAVCASGTLMLDGKAPCDGRMDAVRCARCMLTSKGMPRAMAVALSHLPWVPGAWAFHVTGSRMVTALRTRSFMESLHRHTRDFFSEADRIVAVCEWMRDALVVNGVPKSKIVLSRQGLTQSMDSQDRLIPFRYRASSERGPLRIAFLGRMDPMKGAHLLIDAVLAESELNLQLDLFCIPQYERGGYAARLRSLADADLRIRIHDPVPSADAVDRLRGYDLLAVPSLCMETGPLVVLEAFAAGIPVIATRLGGMREIVTDGIDGVLVEPMTESWRAALRDLADNPSRIDRLTEGVRFPRAMADAADDMIALYKSLHAV
jgi:glycosyltransferase involved in cell wall biosynthesis